MTSLIHGRLFGRVAGTLAVVAAVACGSSPSSPTALPTGAMLPVATSFGGQAAANLGQCLGGSGDPSCFTAGSMRTASVNSGAAVGTPINLSATVSGNVVSLSWTPPASGDPVTNYVIEAGSSPGLTNRANALLPNITSVTAPDVPFGVYYVRVRAGNPTSGLGAPSNEIVVTVGGCAGPPQGLFVASQSAGTISLAWTAPASGSPSSYLIIAGSAPGLSNVITFDTRNPNPSIVVRAVPAGSYYVRVHSNSSCGLSAASNEVLVFAVGSSGDVQVSVSWDAPTDVDLHVVEPSGEETYYGHPASATGGQLDVDSNAGCSIDGRQIENIRWPGRAPAGPYTVRVDYWDSCGVGRTNYLVTLRNGLSVQTFTGFFTGPGDNGGEGSGITIGTFVHAASDAPASADEPVFRAPALFTPSPIKLRLRR